ncbi:MAG: hypothetical protein ACRDNF_06025 [Streptosporangiaceae bacterium]
MSELRYRHPDEATAPKPDHPQQRDSPRQPDQRITRPDHDAARSYDADADFKRPVPKPDDYLPDDTGGTEPSDAELRDHRSWVKDHADIADLTPGRDPAQAPRLREVAEGDHTDTLTAVVDRPDFHDPTDNRSPDRYGDPLTRPDGTRVPCLDGPPRREETRQGWAGDCGIIAALGAVAAHKPEEIARRIQPQDDGTYKVTLSEARRSESGVSEPTGREIAFSITPQLPVRDEDPGTPACAKIEDGTSWCAVMEKAFAGIDQTWSTERRISWLGDWAGMCAQDQASNAENPRSGPAPSGYARLHQGTSPWERAEALTQLTGQSAEVREFPAGREEWRINRIIRSQLDDGKPILVGARKQTHERELLPHGLKDSHMYEVIGVQKGKILLRNPWNEEHPEPMETDEFARNMSRYYSTLT